MTEEKLTQGEFAAIFGDTIPMEAVDLVFNGPADMTIGEVRKKLLAMGKDHKRRQAVADAIYDRLKPYTAGHPSHDLDIDWPWIFSDAARSALEAADAIAAPGGVPFDDAARTALAEIGAIAYNMKQSAMGDNSRAEFARISQRADLLLELVDKARAGS